MRTSSKCCFQLSGASLSPVITSTSDSLGRTVPHSISTSPCGNLRAVTHHSLKSSADPVSILCLQVLWYRVIGTFHHGWGRCVCAKSLWCSVWFSRQRRNKTSWTTPETRLSCLLKPHKLFSREPQLSHTSCLFFFFFPPYFLSLTMPKPFAAVSIQRLSYWAPFSFLGKLWPLILTSGFYPNVNYHLI